MEPEKKRKARTHILKVRIDEAVLRQLEQQAATVGMDKSKYVRQLIHKPCTFSKNTGHRYIVLLSRIANDLDMIARWTLREHESVDAQMVILHLLRIERHIWFECMHGGPQS